MTEGLVSLGLLLAHLAHHDVASEPEGPGRIASALELAHLAHHDVASELVKHPECSFG